MINTTDNILILEKDDNKLIQELRSSLLEVRNLIIKESNIESIPDTLDKETKSLAFVYHFTEEKINCLPLDKKFIENIIDYTEEKDGNNICVEYGFCPSNIILQNYFLKIGLKITLLSLWKKRLILLPIRFQVGEKGVLKLEKYFNTPICEKYRKFFDNKTKEKYSKEFLGIFVARAMRVLRTTDYQNFNDVKIEEINSLHIFIIESQSGRIVSKVPNGNFYLEMFLLEVKNNRKDFNFDSFEYKQWLVGYSARYKKFNYVEYQSEKGNLKEYRRKYNLEDTKKRIKEKSINNTLDIDQGEVKEDFLPKELSLEEEFFEVTKITKSWEKNPPIYQGFEFLENYEISRKWVKAYKSFIEQRIKNGYETTKTQKTVFNLLMDYIFFYLNMYSQKHGNINIPCSPKDFKRVLFIKTTEDKKNRPLTLMELLESKERPNSFKNSVLHNLENFFNHISDYYEEDLEMWNPANKNPIRESDYYIERKHNKTNKVIIPKKTYSYLKKYLYALENFGNYLLKKYAEEDVQNIKDLTSKEILKCEEFGFIPCFYVNNKLIYLKEVPNVYHWRLRTFDKNKLFHTQNSVEEVVTKWIPSNTFIRTFILTLNTGLRSAQTLWLDIRTWDSLNDPNKQQAYYKININTDKFKNEDWTTFISHQVRNSLLEETLFQKSMKEDFMNKECNYKSREYTRFSNILPLFRASSKDGNPIPYNTFSNNWIDVLWVFQNFLNQELNEKYELVTIEKPNNIRVEGTDNKYCPLNIRAIHTPHSMRATFCTHMAEYLERSEIAELVGHASDLVTSEVYIKPGDELIKEKIAKAIDVLDNGVNASYFEKNSSAHIKPNLSSSSLQKAFSQDREQTIELFNITSISLNINQESEVQSKKAIKLLKDARMDQIIFEPTHICPVGGMCPQEVMNIIAEKRRCGLCPLALKCVDNLNPIYAKQRDLMREIKNGKEKLDIAIKEGESEIALSQIEEKVNLDIRELVSWKFSSEILSNHYEQIKGDKDIEKKFYVEKPDMVKNHLVKVSVSNEREYILTRLADANSYTQFNNPENKYRAELLRKEIIKNLNLIDYEDLNVSEEQRIEVFCAMIKNMLESNKIGLHKLVEYDAFKAIEQQKSKQAQLFNNKQILLLK